MIRHRRLPTIRMTALVAVLALLLAGLVDGLIDRRIGDSAPERFDDVTVRLGETATIDGVQITVDRMESAYQLEGGALSGDQNPRSSGIFLVFTVRAEALGGPRMLNLKGELAYAGVRTGLRQVLPTPDPGTVETGPAWLEVDPQALRESIGKPVQLRLWHTQLTYRYRSRVVVDLAMDRQRVEALIGVPPATRVNIAMPKPRGIR